MIRWYVEFACGHSRGIPGKKKPKKNDRYYCTGCNTFKIVTKVSEG